jgi:DNA-binding CsgD family transcriptional regulator
MVNKERVMVVNVKNKPSCVLIFKQANYWSMLINELVSHGQPDATSYFIPSPSVRQSDVSTKGAKSLQRFYLGGQFPGIYLSFREAQCMCKLLEGKTLKVTGKELQLSTRTVEFYVSNIKKKLHCKKKKELIELVKQSEFSQVVNDILL